MTVRRLAVLAAALVLASGPLGAATLYVDWQNIAGGDDAGCGTSPANPCRTIQFAYERFRSCSGGGNSGMPCLVAGDCPSGICTGSYLPVNEIRVLPGTYNECVMAWGAPDADQPVRIVAEAWLTDQDQTQTIIDGIGICSILDSGATVSLGGTDARLEGFTVTNGGASGVSARGSVVITNNLITGNTATQGGGIYLYTAACYYTGDVNATISNNTITLNTASDTVQEPLGDGAGIWIWAAGFQPAPPSCLGGDANVTVQGNEITDNFPTNANPAPFSLAAGLGVYVNPNTLPLGGGAPAASGSARVVVTQNTISGNLSDPGTFVFGGGIWVGTYYDGDWTVEITDNEISGNFASANGGGISTHFEDTHGDQTILIDDNAVTGNFSNGSGGGVDLLAFHNLIAGNTFSLKARNNTITTNFCGGFGAGMFVEYESLGSIASSDLADFPAEFPDPPSPADEITFLLESNTISGNEAFSGAGGVLLQLTAHGDPTSLPPTLCDPLLPAVARIDFVNNLVTDNTLDIPQDDLDLQIWAQIGCSDPVCQDAICAVDPYCCGDDPDLGGVWDDVCQGEALAQSVCDSGCAGTSNCCLEPKVVSGVGLLILTESIGPAVSIVNVETSTVVQNHILDAGYVGGIEMAALTGPDCASAASDCTGSGPCYGETEITINRSIVAFNDVTGIGGPRHAPDDRLTATVTRTSSFGNGGAGGDDYENTIFPGDIVPPGNIVADPLLDPDSYVPDVCSPVFDIGTCSSDSRICEDDNDCGTCVGGANNGQPCTIPPGTCPGGACVAATCVPEGAGYLANPDSNEDNTVDGIDILNLAVAFGASENDSPALPDPRYDPSVDLDRNGIVDGADLAFMSPVFAEVCP